MDNDFFDLDDFKSSVGDLLEDVHLHADELDSTLVELINIIRLNEVASTNLVMSNKARKDRVTKVLDKLYSDYYSSNGVE